MLFSSMVFIWVFLPIVIIGYYIIDHLPFADPDSRMSVKNYFLLGASLFFYAWGGIYYLLIMISSIVVNFFGGKYIDRKSTRLNSSHTDSSRMPSSA